MFRTTSIPFLLIVVPKVVAVLVGLYFVFRGYATLTIRGTVGAAVLASFLLQTTETYSWPWTCGLLLQVGVSLYVLLHFQYHGWLKLE